MIENIYIQSEPVAQVYVHGDSLKAFLVGIVVPDAEVMPSWAQKRGIEGTYAELCEIICSSSVKNTIGSLIGIALKLWNYLF